MARCNEERNGYHWKEGQEKIKERKHLWSWEIALQQRKSSWEDGCWLGGLWNTALDPCYGLNQESFHRFMFCSPEGGRSLGNYGAFRKWSPAGSWQMAADLWKVQSGSDSGTPYLLVSCDVRSLYHEHCHASSPLLLTKTISQSKSILA